MWRKNAFAAISIILVQGLAAAGGGSFGGQGVLRTKSLGPLVREARDPSGSWKPPRSIPGGGARKADVRGVLDLRGGAGSVVDGQVVAWRELTRRCSAGEGMCEDEARALRDGADWRKDAPDECRYKL